MIEFDFDSKPLITKRNPMKELETQLKNSEFLQQIIAELRHEQTTQRAACEQAIAMLATACARQMNAETLAQTLERMECQFALHMPNARRTEMIRFAASLVRNSGTPAAPPH